MSSALSLDGMTLMNVPIARTPHLRCCPFFESLMPGAAVLLGASAMLHFWAVQ